MILFGRQCVSEAMGAGFCQLLESGGQGGLHKSSIGDDKAPGRDEEEDRSTVEMACDQVDNRRGENEDKLMGLCARFVREMEQLAQATGQDLPDWR